MSLSDRVHAAPVAALVLTLVMFVSALSFAPRAHAQAAPDSVAVEDLVVGQIHVTGNSSVDSARVVRTFEVASGQPFNMDAIRRGTRKLVGLGLFSDVKVLRRRMGTTVDLTIVVTERARLATVGYTGNKKREDSDLDKKIFLRRGEVYSATAVQTQVDSLLYYYREEGFPRAKVESKVDSVAGRNEVNVQFVIDEGEKLRITAVRFEGARAFPTAKLRKALKTKPKGFFGGGQFKDEAFPEDRERLEAFYRSHGYRDARVTDIRVEPGREPRKVTLVATVEEGAFHRIGAVSWSGNKAVDSTSLARLWRVKPGERYDVSRIERVKGLAYGEYAEHGYLYVNVESDETVRDSTVDVTYAVTEGSPSHVRRVNIVGNKGTREKVIRREIDLHEGDLFRRSALMRTQDDLRRLGLFEEVTPDFTAAESTDVDIQLKVKEKQVGTASAGAGYTGDAGLTGFLELGHNNVLGNGQSLQLHLERGSRREDYSLSFTEPWFRDTPTLLGISAYNTQRYRDLSSTTSLADNYDERRAGGSLRVGRPLPWPDYSRGSISYSLEGVRLDNLELTFGTKVVDGQTVNDTTSVQRELIRLSQKSRLTSTFETNFVRNSTDNAFYPTRGTRLTVNEEFAGGPFGGEVSFIKHRWEGRMYLPSVMKPITTMLRYRIGLLGSYTVSNWQRSEVPNYETFRLGGGNTMDPLRGYEDYQVVPGKFIVTIVQQTKTIANIDSVTTPGRRDTTYNIVETGRYKQRYPGGKYLELFTMEQQFPIVAPLRGVFFLDAGNVWDLRREIKPFQLKVGAGLGFRMEIPLLGNIGFDYGYGFNRDDGAKWQGHFLLGNVNF